MTSFICPECKAGAHDKCPGGTWCDCLHRKVQAWGQAQAASAPPWSERTWREALSCLGTHLR